MSNNIEKVFKIKTDKNNLSREIEKINKNYKIKDKEKFKKELMKQISYQNLLKGSNKNCNNLFNNENINDKLTVNKTYTDISKITFNNNEKSFNYDNYEDREFYKMENKFENINTIKENELKDDYEKLFKKLKNQKNDKNNSNQKKNNKTEKKINHKYNKYSNEYINYNYERLYNEKNIFDSRLKALKNKKSEIDRKECTFTPNIKKYNFKDKSADNVFNKLYKDAKNKLMKKNINNTSRKSNLSYKKFDANKFKNYQINKENKRDMINYIKDNYDMKTGQKYYQPKISNLNLKKLNKINLKKMENIEKSKKLDKLLFSFFNILSNNKNYIDTNKIDVNIYNEKFLISFESIFIILIRQQKKLNYDEFFDLILDNNLLPLFIKFKQNKNHSIKKQKEDIIYKSFSYKIKELINN